MLQYQLKSLFLCLLIGFGIVANAQDSVKSPTEYFGYEYGTHMPTFREIHDYFTYLAGVSPHAQYFQYGYSYERRPLSGLILGTEENLARLDSIQSKHHRSMKEDVKYEKDDPLILWLSYGVHGNEAGATSTAPEAAYRFLTSHKEVLRDAILIMDPCVNPDGYDRYTTWYNQVASIPADSRREVVEHNEPWPSGRVNHYQFDLNRDWLWLSQVESQNRIALYREWMPHLHIDFHEQYPDAWYFFPPPAEPVHPYITDFQRDAQDSFGLSNARIFDENGWPYYTQEWFDLYYPSYGDTYPLFNGAIGMTYEQGGHGRAGLIYELSNGDSLRLSDRIEHHLATGIATVKRSIELKDQLQSAQSQFFRDGRMNETKDVRAYAIFCESEKQRQSLHAFFHEHQILTSDLPQHISLTGYSYKMDKPRNVLSGEYGILIDCQQAQSKLIHVLMEPENQLSEVKTYDITAWAIPYLWGLETIALKQMPRNTEGQKSGKQDIVMEKNRGSFLGYRHAYKSLEDLKIVTAMMNAGYKLRVFKAEGETPYFICLKADNKELAEEDFQSGWTLITSGSSLDYDLGSWRYRLLEKPEVALVKTELASVSNYGFIWHYFEQELEYPLHRIDIDNLASQLSKYNTVIFPDGTYDLNPFLKSKIKDFMQAGGKVIFMKNAAQLLADELEFQVNTEGSEWHNPGSFVRIKWDNEDPMGWAMPDYLDCLILGNNAFRNIENGINVGYIEKWEMNKGYMDEELKPFLENSVRFTYKNVGSGKAIYMMDDPLFRGFWERGKQLFTNAIILM